ncbi:MAG: hypothetical protein KA277_07030 [Fusobacteriaceae bacterium]|nr:hypothetical protein [Fusobacteriaceae bacterium]
MNYNDFLSIYFSNISLFLIIFLIIIPICYYSVNYFSISKLIDPIHFFWTYTFGTTYSIIIGLYILNQISTYLIILISISALIILISFFIGYKANVNIIKYPIKLLTKSNDGHLIFKFSFFLLCILYIIIISKIGLTIFSEENRFQQNKGIGPLVRVADALRPFVLAYSAVYISFYFKAYKRILGYIILFSVAIISSLSNGAKFALLEIIYAISTCFILYTGSKFKITFSKLIKILFYFIVVLIFALSILHFSLKNSNIVMKPQYLSEETPIVIEKIFLRTLSNGDQSYLGLPNDVIEKIPDGSLINNILSSITGKENFRRIFLNNDELSNVGQKILKYHFPSFDSAGGPVSHFDLYFYHYLPIGLNFIAIFLMGLLLISIVNNRYLARGNIFISSIIATLWVRGLIMLLEPAMGLTYIIDFLFMMMLIKVLILLLPKKRSHY